MLWQPGAMELPAQMGADHPDAPSKAFAHENRFAFLVKAAAEFQAGLEVCGGAIRAEEVVDGELNSAGLTEYGGIGYRGCWTISASTCSSRISSEMQSAE